MTSRMKSRRSRRNPPTPEGQWQWDTPAAQAPQTSPVAGLFRWLIGLAFSVGMVALLVVVVVGAFNFGPVTGIGALLGALAVIYFMARER